MASVSVKIGYADVSAAVADCGLSIYGSLHLDPGEAEGVQTMMLLGPSPSFWSEFRRSPEWCDGTPDPVDRWSRRVIDPLATSLSAQAFFPFGGPPYAPFLNWALRSGRCWQSPVGMLVHDTTGLMVSFRGALGFSHHIDLPEAPALPPCDTCQEQPCRNACPVGALGLQGYATDKCHGHLKMPEGADCLDTGCRARRACPVSAGANRSAEQSRHHMSYFHRG